MHIKISTRLADELMTWVQDQKDAAFLALAAGAENLVTYVFGPGAFWIVGGTYVAGLWAYQAYCKEGLEP